MWWSHLPTVFFQTGHFLENQNAGKVMRVVDGDLEFLFFSLGFLLLEVWVSHCLLVLSTLRLHITQSLGWGLGWNRINKRKKKKQKHLDTSSVLEKGFSPFCHTLSLMVSDGASEICLFPTSHLYSAIFKTRKFLCPQVALASDIGVSQLFHHLLFGELWINDFTSVFL